MRHVVITIATLVITAVPLSATASARGGDDDGGGGGRGGGRSQVEVAGSCGRGATAALRLRGRDGALRVRFEVEHARAGRSWRVALIQDRRIVWRGAARTGPRGAFEVERTLRDLPGAERIAVRAAGPAGLTCFAAAALPG